MNQLKLLYEIFVLYDIRFVKVDGHYDKFKACGSKASVMFSTVEKKDSKYLRPAYILKSRVKFLTQNFEMDYQLAEITNETGS